MNRERGASSLALVLTLAACLIFLATCSSHDTPAQLESPGAQRFDLPQLPAPAQLAPGDPQRSAALVPADLYSDGAGYEEELGHQRVARDGDAADFTPDYPAAGSNGLAYGLYRFSVSGYDGAPQIRLIWSAAPASDADWLGLANFTANRWDWFAVPASGTVSPVSMAPYINGTGALYAAVVVTGTTAGELARLRLGDVLVSGDLKAVPAQCIAGTEVLLEASTLTVNGGSIVNFEWDLDGDGTFELDTDLVDNVLHAYSVAGSYQPAVRVFTDEGQTVTAATAVEVLSGEWEVYELTAAVDFELTYSYPSVAVVGGRAAVAYVQHDHKSNGELSWTENSLKYTYADATQSENGWSAPVTMVPYDPEGSNAEVLGSLLEVSGRPTICYSGTAGQLCYLRAADALGAGWPADPIVLSSDAAGLGFDAELEIINGNPALAYIAYESGTATDDLKFSRAEDAEGTIWPTLPTVWHIYHGASGTAGVHGPVSLALIDGYPAASAYEYYQTFSVFRLDFSPDGFGGWLIERDSSDPAYDVAIGRLGSHTALVGADFNTYPAVRWFEDIWDQGAASYAQTCEEVLNCQSMSWGGPCLQYDAGVCYQDANNEDLRFCGISGPDVNSELAMDPGLVDGGEHRGYRCNMTVLEGKPLIVYEEHDFELQPHSIWFAVMR